MGNLSMKEKIHVRKLNLLHHLKNLNSDSLGHEFYHLQVKYNFPGLVKECRTLIKTYSLPNIIDENLNFPKQKWKQLVKKAVRSKSERDIKIECSKYSKLEYLNTETEELKVQDYITVLSLRKARTKFRIRSRMIDVKMNKKSDKKYANELWRCDFCQSIDSQAHIVWCPAFAPLREGKNLHDDEDLVEYFENVMKIRNETE